MEEIISRIRRSRRTAHTFIVEEPGSRGGALVAGESSVNEDVVVPRAQHRTNETFLDLRQPSTDSLKERVLILRHQEGSILEQGRYVVSGVSRVYECIIILESIHNLFEAHISDIAAEKLRIQGLDSVTSAIKCRFHLLIDGVGKIRYINTLTFIV